MAKSVYALITLTNQQTIQLELFPDKAPISVENFVMLAKKGHYNGTVFHRIIDHFMIQTGGYKISDYTLKELPETKMIYGEFAHNGWEKNDIKHTLGVISMARTQAKDSATSQFFLCSADASWLDGEYAAFGKTIDEKSNQVIQAVSGSETGYLSPAFSDFPVEPIGIDKIEIQVQPFMATI